MVLIALDIDGTLIDTRDSFTRIVKELSGATDGEIERFRNTGRFNDDWELTRACIAWIGAGRPDVFTDPRGADVGWQGVVALCGHDPGDMAPQCTAMYRGGYWRHERTLVDGEVLRQLAQRHRVAACTGRDAWEFERAQELLGFTFASFTTMEHAKKPDPRALLRLVRPDDDVVVLLGDTEADRQCAANAGARYVHVTPTHPASALLVAWAGGIDVLALLDR